MTFIASVIARDGVAIVADSFTTSVQHSIDLNDFSAYLKNKPTGDVDIKEIIGLFKEKASYTQDYTDKLVRFDSYTAITSAGEAFINGRRTKEVLTDISNKCTATGSKTIEKTLDEICEHLRTEAINHIETRNKITTCAFIVSHYDMVNNKPKVFKIRIEETNKEDIGKNVNHDFIGWKDETGFKIVSDGQDRMVDRLLFGSIYIHATSMTNAVANKIFSELNTSPEEQERIKSILTTFDTHILAKFWKRDMDLINIRTLSLQEAVNLAALLIRIVRDIQIYTEKIPTVGGLIKLAVIQKDKGFRYITGDKISIPNIVH